jgi:exodeoxyribonuclease V alpha subunit
VFERNRQGRANEPQESVEGLIERVTFFNEENGFAVLRLKVKGQRDLVTVLGSLPAVNAGEWVRGEGVWVRDSQHGLQFKAESLHSTAPNTREGIEKYLGSGLVKGIGPVLAKKLVSRFGEGIFDVIDNQSARLEEVDDVGPKRRRRIKEAWAEQKVVREIMVFLHAHGAGSSRAVRIYKTYGERAIEIVRDNPYKLARDIHGIGFKTADAIARKLGIAADSPKRAAAGLQHALFVATNEGHCALPEDLLIRHTAELLGIEEDIVTAALTQALAQEEVIKEQVEERALIYLPSLLTAEKAIARRMRHLAGQPSPYPAIDLESAVGWYETKTSRQLSASQREALGRAFGSRAFIITGGPGVGKTTLLDALLSIIRAKRVKCLLCAPTGRAAQRLSEATGMEAKTIHRLLGFGDGGMGFQRNEQQPLEADLLVVDECSMVDLPLMHALLRALPKGAGLLLVGDVDQLPSVGPGLVLRNLIDSGAVPTARLTEIFRQAAESRIITNAHRINAGSLPDLQASNDAAADFFFIEREQPERIVETLIEVVRERIPKKWGLDPARDIQVLCPTNRGAVGARELNAHLQEAMNPAREGEPTVNKFGWQFRLRDKVIQTQNNYDKEVFNGDLGFVTKIDPAESELAVRFETRTVVFGFGELDELAPAYSITIHKSQGSEFPAVVIPLAMSQFMLLQRNLLYTGVTRGRRLVVLVGQRKALGVAVRQQSDRNRFGGLLARLRGDNALNEV